MFLAGGRIQTMWGTHVSYAADEEILVRVRERPKTVTVVVADRFSQGRWNNNEEVFDCSGPDTSLLKGAMVAWGSLGGGRNCFTCSYEQLYFHSGGWLAAPGVNDDGTT